MKKIFEHKKKLIIIIFLIIIGIIFLILKDTYSIEQNNGITGDIKIICDSNNILPNETLNCAIRGENFTTQVSSYSTKLILSENLTLVNIEKDSSWEGSGEGGIIDLYTDINKTGNFNLATFSIKASSINTGLNTNISLQNTVISDEKFTEYTLNNSDLDIRIQSTINTLSDLDISGLAFNFNQDIITYDLATDLESVTISAIATSSTAVITGDIGTKSLSYGKNSFQIIVTSESGSTKTYTLNINRPEKLSFSSDVKVDEENMLLQFNESELTINKIKNKINTTGRVSIKDKNGNNVTENDYVGTGFKINIELSKETHSYTVIVLGDTTGDGQVSVTDVSKLFQHYRKTNIMEDIYVLSGNVQNDSEIKLTDVAKLFQYVRGSIESLE